MIRQLYTCIEQESKQYSVKELCNMYEMSRSGYYMWLKRKGALNRYELQQQVLDCQNQQKVHFESKSEKQSQSILKAFWTWCSSVDALRNSPLSKAIGYTTGQKNILGSFLLDGRIPLSNNPDENAIHPFVTGRKNWLFSNTPNGAAGQPYALEHRNVNSTRK